MHACGSSLYYRMTGFARTVPSWNCPHGDHGLSPEEQTWCRVINLQSARERQLEFHARPGVDPNAKDIDILTDDYPCGFQFKVTHCVLTDYILSILKKGER